MLPSGPQAWAAGRCPTLVPQKSQPRKDRGHLSSQNRCSQQLCPFLAELALCSRKAGASALGTAVSA